jgi:hypothetical protein
MLFSLEACTFVIGCDGICGVHAAHNPLYTISSRQWGRSCNHAPWLGPMRMGHRQSFKPPSHSTVCGTNVVCGRGTPKTAATTNISCRIVCVSKGRLLGLPKSGICVWFVPPKERFRYTIRPEEGVGVPYEPGGGRSFPSGGPPRRNIPSKLNTEAPRAAGRLDCVSVERRQKRNSHCHTRPPSGKGPPPDRPLRRGSIRRKVTPPRSGWELRRRRRRRRRAATATWSPAWISHSLSLSVVSALGVGGSGISMTSRCCCFGCFEKIDEADWERRDACLRRRHRCFCGVCKPKVRPR